MPMKKPILVAGILVFVLTVSLLTILLLPKDLQSPPDTTDTPTSQVLFDLNDTACIEQLSFTYEGKKEISVSRTSVGWQITDHPGLPVDADQMATLLNRLSQMLALRTITEDCHDLSEYGLDTPSLKLTLIADGVSKTYLFGDTNSYFQGYYGMVEGTSAVYILDFAYVTLFDLSVEELLLTEDLPPLSLPTALTFTTASGNEIKLTATELAKLTQALATLSIDRMVDYGKEKYAVYGLDKAVQLKLTFSDGTDYTLRLSEGETEELIYLTIGNKELIYLVNCKDAQTLLAYIRME